MLGWGIVLDLLLLSAAGPQAPTGLVPLPQIGHLGAVQCLALSPDGQWLATGSQDHTAIVWHLPTRAQVWTLEEFRGGATAVAFSPDGATLAVGAEDAEAALWDLTTGQQVGTVPALEGSLALAWSPDGRLLAGRNRAGKVTVLDVTAGRVAHTFEGGAVSRGGSVAFSPDSRLLASGTRDGLVLVWDLQTGQVARRLAGHETDEPVGAVAFSPDGLLLASGSHDGTAILWDAATGALLHHLDCAGMHVSGVAFSPDGRALATCSLILTLWDPATGAELRRLADDPGHHLPTSAAFTPDGTGMVTGSEHSNALVLWDVASGEVRGRWGEHRAPLTAVAFTPDGRRLLTTSRSGSGPDLWDATTGAHLRALAVEGGAAAVSISPDGSRIAAGGQGGAVMVWDAETGTVLRRLAGGTGPITEVVFGPVDSLVTLDYGGKAVMVWDLGSGAAERTFATQEPAEPHGMTISRDGCFVTTKPDGDLFLVWSTETGRQVGRVPGDGDDRTVPVLSPDGRLLALTGPGRRRVTVWEVATGELAETLEGERAVSGSLFPDSGDGGGGTGRAALWDAAVATRVRQFLTPRTAHPLAVSPDGRVVVATGEGYEAVLWDMEGGARLDALRGHHDDVNGADFSPDGLLVATVAGDGTCKLWDVPTGELRATLWAPTDPNLTAGGSMDAPMDPLWVATGEWLAWTPEGYYTCSEGADRFLAFRDGEGAIHPAAEVADRLRSPERVAAALRR